MKVWLSLAALVVAAVVARAEAPLQVGDEPTSGLSIVSESGLRMNLQIVDQRWRLYFVAEDKVIEPPVDTVVIRGEEHRKRTNEFRYLLNLSPEGPFLTSDRNLVPPFDYWLWVILNPGSPEPEIISQVRFRQ